MKTILLGLLFALLAPACVDSMTDDASPSETAASEPSARVETSSAALPAAFTCVGLCLSRYDNCMTNAQTDRDACLCRNALVRCELPCGIHGILEFC